MNCNRLILTIVFTLAGCGGGASAPNSVSNSSSLTLSGTAATGMAIPSAPITAKCQVGAGSATTKADGTYSLPIANGQLPCVLQITNPANGSKLHSVATSNSVKVISNITPITEMVVARLLRTDPNNFFSNFDYGVAARSITASSIKVAQADVATVLGGTIDTRTLDDVIATPFVAATVGNAKGGDAQDHLLDDLAAKFNSAQFSLVSTALENMAEIGNILQVIESFPKPPPIVNGYISFGGLTWMPTTFTMFWADANHYCTTTSNLGQVGWRLPTTSELVDLQLSGVLKGKAWTLGDTWASTQGGANGEDANVHWYSNLNGTGRGWDAGDKTNRYVTCVR